MRFLNLALHQGQVGKKLAVHMVSGGREGGREGRDGGRGGGECGVRGYAAPIVIV